MPLDYTIDVTLKRVYEQEEVITNIPRDNMKELLLLCTKSVHFSYNNSIYRQTDGVAMGSPLGPVLAGIFMTHLEKTLIPKMNHMTPWIRYVDDTFATIDSNKIERALNELNSFHPSIQFTYELEKDNCISFLDVKLNRDKDSVSTTVYRKPTNTEVYMKWSSYAPKSVED